MGTDPFRTGELRDRVLRAWEASPARFREDANAEEDHALGGYRDRVIIELAQNAADAAVRAGVPGRLRLTLRDGVLSAANRGVPLDAAGVEALSTLRASAKRHDGATVGRFGVGFAAVVAVSDEPAIISRHASVPATDPGAAAEARPAVAGGPGLAGVAWSVARTRELAAHLPALAEELTHRSGHVPLLRLPFPAGSEVLAAPRLLRDLAVDEGTSRTITPGGQDGGGQDSGGQDGFDTVVWLPLRDAEAEQLVRRLLDQVGPALMLALPVLEAVEIDVDGSSRTLTAAHRRAAPYDRGERPSREAVAGRATSGGAAPGQAAPGEAIPGEAIPDRAAPEAAAPGDALSEGVGTVLIDGVWWRTVEVHGPIKPELLADRPTEERARPVWWIRWAIPAETGTSGRPDRGPQGMTGPPRGLPSGVPAVIHGPTPSDEPLGLPALLIASFPLAPDRRHVAPGPLTDFLVERAAEAYLRLLRDIEPTPRLLDLVPGPVAAGELDARIRRDIRALLPDVPLLPAAVPGSPTGSAAGAMAGSAAGATAGSVADSAWDEGGGPLRLRGRDTVAVDGPAALIALLAEVFPGLLPAGWPVHHQGLTALGVRRMEMADVVDALVGLDREPAWWHRLYTALAGVDSDGLGALPVPLATAGDGDGDGDEHGDAGIGDLTARTAAGTGAPAVRGGGFGGGFGRGGGRTVRGPRGLLVAAEGIDPVELSSLSSLGLRFVHPQAAHPLLLKLGAVEAGPRAVLQDPAVRAAVAGSFDADDPDAVADAVLALVAAAHVDPGDEPWLSDLALPDLDGELRPAGELLLPDSPLRSVMADDSPFGVVDPALVERHGADALESAGVLRTFALLREQDVTITDDGLDRLLDLDDEDAWAADVLDRLPTHDLPPLIPELTAVRDLELVGDWSAALGLLAERPLRAALAEPAQVLLGDGRRVAVPSYTAWWLRRQPILGGRRPEELCSRDADPLLLALYDQAPVDLEPGLSRALGVRRSVDELLAEPGGAAELLERLADPGRTVSRAQLRDLWTVLAATDDAEPVERLRAVVDGAIEVVPAVDALVLDRPDLLPLLAAQPLIIVPYELAERIAVLLDLTVTSEEIPGEVQSEGRARPVPPFVREILPEAPRAYTLHDRLVVDGMAVAWRYTGGVVHVGRRVDHPDAATAPAASASAVPQAVPGHRETGAAAAVAEAYGLARGLAWAAGRWDERLLLESALRAPETLPALLAESDFE